jgi:hypothetical protein
MGFAQASPLAPPSTQVLDKLRERIEVFHYSAQTARTYLRWARAFLRWLQLNNDHGWQPRELGPGEVNGFMAMLAERPGMSPATHRQALSALLFLYRHVLGRDLLLP